MDADEERWRVKPISCFVPRVLRFFAPRAEDEPLALGKTIHPVQQPADPIVPFDEYDWCLADRFGWRLHARSASRPSGAVEGLNNKVKLVIRKSYGFRTAEVAKLALNHNLDRLPEPEFTHKFC